MQQKLMSGLMSSLLQHPFSWTWQMQFCPIQKAAALKHFLTLFFSLHPFASFHFLNMLLAFTLKARLSCPLPGCHLLLSLSYYLHYQILKNSPAASYFLPCSSHDQVGNHSNICKATSFSFKFFLKKLLYHDPYKKNEVRLIGRGLSTSLFYCFPVCIYLLSYTDCNAFQTATIVCEYCTSSRAIGPWSKTGISGCY